MKPGIHPAFLKYKHLKLPLYAGLLPFINAVMTKALYLTPVGAGLAENVYAIAGYHGDSIRLSVIGPLKSGAPLPGLVYLHGGAFAFQTAPHHKRLVAAYARKTPCKVILVDYRLLPKAIFPTGLEDCYSAYEWVLKNAETLGIDSGRIAIAGDSAGGALSVGVCLLARERGLKAPCFQMLIYPVTDMRQNTPSMREYTDTPLWNSRLNAKMWRMYLKGVAPEKQRNASPMSAPSFAGMPPTYVEVSEFDCLRDEGIAFSKKLQENGVSTELFQTRGTVHGFELAEHSEIVRESVALRAEKLKKAFAPIKSPEKRP